MILIPLTLAFLSFAYAYWLLRSYRWPRVQATVLKTWEEVTDVDDEGCAVGRAGLSRGQEQAGGGGRRGDGSAMANLRRASGSDQHLRGRPTSRSRWQPTQHDRPLLHGVPDALREHTRRTAELEQEYLRRHPERDVDPARTRAGARGRDAGFSRRVTAWGC